MPSVSESAESYALDCQGISGKHTLLKRRMWWKKKKREGCGGWQFGSWNIKKTILFALVVDSIFGLDLLGGLCYPLGRKTWKD